MYLRIGAVLLALIAGGCSQEPKEDAPEIVEYEPINVKPVVLTAAQAWKTLESVDWDRERVEGFD